MADEDLDVLDTVPPEERAASLEGSGARALARQGRRTPQALEPLPVVADQASYEALSFGQQYKDVDGNPHTKAWKVANDVDYDAVPEGAQYVDPSGTPRTKASFQDVSFTAHTLYNMAVNDTERRKALERSYPGRVKQDAKGGYYVEEDDGTLRKPRAASDPKAGPLQTGALIAGAGLPTAGAVGGEILGGLAGSAVAPGPGTIAGAIGGAGAGGAIGQSLNDIILKWTGIYDRTLGEQAKETGLATAFGAGGAAAGRAIAAAGPAIMGKITQGAPKAVAGAIGADETALKAALALSEAGEHESSSRLLRSWGISDPGTRVPLSAWAKEAPMLHIEEEVLHPTFFKQRPLDQSRKDLMETQGKKILGDIGEEGIEAGVNKSALEGSLTEPTAAVSGLSAGQKLIDRATAQSVAQEEQLAAKIAAARTEREAGITSQVPAHEARMAEVRAAAEAADNAADRVVNAGYASMREDIDNGMRAARAGHNSGDFWTSVADKLRDIRAAIGERAGLRYGGWEQTHGALVPEQEGLAAAAREFIEELPKPFQEMRPALIKKLRRLAGEEVEGSVEATTGAMAAQEAAVEPATLAELHEIRSLFRAGADWSTLTSDVKNGALKRFAQMLDDTIGAARTAAPEFRQAWRDLDVIDKWYAKNIKIFNDERMQAVIDGLKSGQPADPKALVQMMIKENNTDFNNKLRRTLGPQQWAGIRATHADELIQKNMQLNGTVNAAGFARDVLDAANSRLLRSIHGEEGAAKIFRQAQNVAAREGTIPVTVRPGDNIMDVIGQARIAAAAVEAEAARDPLKLLEKEMQRFKKTEQDMRKADRGERSKDPLKFLYDKTHGADAAVNKILDSEDLIIATAARFGENSAEFQALRQVAAQRELTGTLDPASRLKKISPEVQKLLFGMSTEDAQLLAKNMAFLAGNRSGTKGTGTSMLATSSVTHPWGRVASGVLKKVPGFNVSGRLMLAKYYDLKVKLMESPSFQRWVLKGLQGDDAAREMVRETVQRWAQRGGAVGAGAGEMLEQTGSEP